MRRREKRFFWGLYGNIAILLVVWMLNLFSLLELPNNLIYDSFVRHIPASIAPAERSLLIDCAEGSLADPDTSWRMLLESLTELGAEQIIFTFFPDAVSRSFYQDVARPDIFFARYLLPGEDTQAEPALSPLPQQAEGTGITIGLLALPKYDRGIYRKQYAGLDFEGKSHPQLLLQAVESRLGASLSGGDVSLVNFNGRPPKSQPRLDLDQALAGNLVPSLVRGRTVLIGTINSSPYSGLHTPQSSGGKFDSLLTYLGYSYDSLLTGKSIVRAGPLLTFLLLTVLVFLGGIFCQYLRIALVLLSSMLAFIITGLLTWGALAYLQLWLPVSELLLAQFLLLVLIVVGKFLLHEEKIQRVVQKTKMRVQERILPGSFYDSDQYWSQIVFMVSQTLNLNRSIFLEAVPDKHFVKEVAADNCSIDDIQERRRDYERTPYSTALETDSVIKVNGYLPVQQEDEYQFLVPLRIRGGGVLGFWASSVDPQRVEDVGQLQELIDNFAVQISEMLHRRKILRLEDQMSDNPLHKLMALEGGQQYLGEIDEYFTLLLNRLNMLERVFNSLGTGAILYDLFGRVVYANREITDICKDIKVSPFQLSGVDLLVILTGRTLDETRKSISNITNNKESESFQTLELGEKKVSYSLTVRPVMAGDGKGEGRGQGQELTPFGIQGILLELSELDGNNRAMKLKEVLCDLSQQYFDSYRISLLQAVASLKKKGQREEAQQKLLTFLDKRLLSLFDYLDRMGELMTRNLVSGTALTFPTDSIQCLHSAMSSLEKEQVVHNLTFDLQVPDYIVPILAVPDELEKVFEYLLRYLMGNAISGSQVAIEVSREYKKIIYRLSNQGYGMPDQDFQNYLAADDRKLSTEFREVRDAREAIRRFDGTLQAKSELGKGTEFIVKLNRFQ